MTFYRCDNVHCGREFIPAAGVLWIAHTYTVCCEPCKTRFLADNPTIIERHLKILGLTIPSTREALLALAAMVL